MLKPFILILSILIINSAISAEANPHITTYFNHNVMNSFKEPYRNIERQGDNFEAQIIAQIEKAKTSIDLAVYEFNLPNIAKALVEKKKQGVKIRIVIDNENNVEFLDLRKNGDKEISKNDDKDTPKEHDQNRYNNLLKLIDIDKDGITSKEEIEERDAIHIINKAKIPKIDDSDDGSEGSGIMHHKFLIIDSKVVVQSSGNFTISDFFGDMDAPNTRGNQNALIVFKNSGLATIYQTEFDQLWAKRFGVQKAYRFPKTVNVGTTAITVQFSPQSASVEWEQTTNGLIGEQLLKATKSIELALFVFSEQNLVDIMQDRAKKNVKISVLIEREFAYREYSELLDIFGLAMPTAECVYEENNNPWKVPSLNSGVPTLPSGDLLHHKFGVIDNKKVIFGSHNWSSAANSSNDEALLIISDTSVAQKFHEEHQRLYKNAKLGIPSPLRENIRERRSTCRNGK